MTDTNTTNGFDLDAWVWACYKLRLLRYAIIAGVGIGTQLFSVLFGGSYQVGHTVGLLVFFFCAAFFMKLHLDGEARRAERRFEERMASEAECRELGA
ncbi:hypothetical protein [Tropicibacter sp. Alg240-R139]|uniref:hypothetical protein n=1 Tax=Tropicibacter sp. Alg240-R139 TaxID=2305991 RepID=UPI0013DEA6A6|nr:hypothetical protein [Tropicibacter sp. Alg240-R139]